MERMAKNFKNNKSGRVAVHMIVYGSSVSDACRANGATQPVGYRAIDEIIGGQDNLSCLQSAYIEYLATGDESEWNSACSGSATGLAQAVVRHSRMFKAERSERQHKIDAISKIMTCEDELLRMMRLMQYNRSRTTIEEWILLEDLGL